MPSARRERPGVAGKSDSAQVAKPELLEATGVARLGLLLLPLVAQVRREPAEALHGASTILGADPFTLRPMLRSRRFCSA